MGDLNKAFTVRLPEAAFEELHEQARRTSIPAAILARTWILENLPRWQMYSGRKFDTGSDPNAPSLELQQRVKEEIPTAPNPQPSRAERRRKKRGK